MSWRNRSLRRRLAFWIIVPLAFVSLFLLLDVRENSRRAANEVFDRVLLGSALAIAERVVIDGDEIVVDVPYVALEMLTSAAQDRVFYQVSKSDRQFITGYSDLPNIPDHLVVAGDQPVFYDAEYKGSQVRVGAVSRFLSSSRLSTRVTIKVAETVGARNALIGELIRDAALRLSLIIIVAAMIVWFGLSRGLKPLETLEQAINRRNREDLRPIEHEVPYEVRNLVASINQLMERLARSIGAMQRFTANAAHQLRTPMAAIKTQTELALKENDPAETQKTLAHLHESAEQTTRLINQLMSLSRAAPTEGGPQGEEFDIRALCVNVTREMVPAALARNIDLGFEGSDEPIPLKGDRTLFEELVKNLIDNTLSYCPSGTRSSVRLFNGSGEVILEVEDDGPGIPAEERERVFERFYRSDASSAPGCGLGLSIVREIARSHDGDAIIVPRSEPGGTLVRVSLAQSVEAS